MRFSRSELLQLSGKPLHLDETIEKIDELPEAFSKIKRIEHARIQGEGEFDPKRQHLCMHLHVQATAICPCVITGQEVAVPVNTADDVTFTFKADDEELDVVCADGEYIDMLHTVLTLILMELPTKIEAPNITEYPKGDGWAIMTEAEFRNRPRETDPRLEVLKNFIPQKEEV